MRNPASLLPEEAVSHYFAVVERHPHLESSIQSFWGTKDFPKWIHYILFDTRDGDRRGFSWEVVEALMSLYKIHDQYFPEHSYQASQKPKW